MLTASSSRGELRWQAGTGERFSVLSEEAGLIDLGAEYPRVVLDPVDGSTNAGRGGLSAVGIVLSLLKGPTMGEVSTGWVFDVLTAREWTTVRAGGTLQDVRRVFTPPPPTSQK